MNERPYLPTSFVIESNAGCIAVTVTVCACGVLLLTGDLAYRHIALCPVWREDQGHD